MERALYINLIFIVLGAISILGLVASLSLINNYHKEICIPDNLGSTYYDGNGNAIVRFDLHDVRQLQLVKAIEKTCYQNDLVNCMNALNRFGINLSN